MKQTIILAMLILASCTASPTGKATDESITIGFLAPLTADYAEWGNHIKNGMELALEDTEHRFKVIWGDSQGCSVKQTVTEANKQINMDDVKMIIGPGCITGLKAIAPMAEEKDVVLFSTGLLDEQVFLDHTNVVNWATQIGTEGEYVAKHFANQGYERVVISHCDDAFCREQRLRFPESLSKHGIELVSIHESGYDVSDFRTVITKIMQDEPDAIFIMHSQWQVGQFVKQLRELGYDTPVTGYYNTQSENTMKTGGAALEGVTYTYPVNSAEGTAEKESFDARYEERYGALPSANSYFVYDGIILLDKALDKCSARDTPCILEYFKNYGEHVGVSGDMEFDVNGKNHRKFGVKTILDGEFRWVSKEI
jgi:branched-chain amino acid transport system substrate-binding protein